jgi:zinc transport system permease protein
MENELLFKAILSGGILGVLLPILGIFLVLKKYAFITDSISHLSLVGIIIGKVLGLNLIITGLFSALISGVIIEKIRQKAKVSSDNILAIILASGLALALILINIFKGQNISITSLLFGSILTTNYLDIGIISLLTVIICLFVYLNYKRLFTLTFDEEFAFSKGMNVNRTNLILILLSAVAIGASIQIFGSLLIGGLIIIPVNIALTFKTNFRNTLIYGIIAAQIINLIGILLSFILNLPSGACIIIVGIAVYLLLLLFKRN